MAFDTPPDISTLFPSKPSLMDKIMSPEALAAITSGGAGVVQSILQNRANANQLASQQQNDRQTMMAQLLAQMNQNNASQDFQRQQAHLDTFNMNPLQQSRAMFSTAALGDLAARGPTRVGPGGVQNPFSVSQFTQGFMSPDALAENARGFYGAAGSLNPSAPAPNLSAMGFGAAGQARQAGLDQQIAQAGQNLATQRSNSRADLLDMMQMAQQQQQQAPQEKKGGGFLGFLKKALPIASMAIPFVGPAIGLSTMAATGVGTGLGIAGSLANRSPMGAASQGMDYFNRMRQR